MKTTPGQPVDGSPKLLVIFSERKYAYTSAIGRPLLVPGPKTTLGIGWPPSGANLNEIVNLLDLFQGFRTRRGLPAR